MSLLFNLSFKKNPAYLTMGLVIICILFRLPLLLSLDLGEDESLYALAGLSLQDEGRLTPMAVWLSWLSHKVFGVQSAWQLRVLPMLMWLLCMLTLYRLAELIYPEKEDRWVGFRAVILVNLSPVFWLNSAHFSPFTATNLFGILSVYSFIYMLRRPSAWIGWIFLGGSLGAMGLTSWMSGLLIVVMVVFLWLSKQMYLLRTHRYQAFVGILMIGLTHIPAIVQGESPWPFGYVEGIAPHTVIESFWGSGNLLQIVLRQAIGYLPLILGTGAVVACLRIRNTPADAHAGTSPLSTPVFYQAKNFIALVWVVWMLAFMVRAMVAPLPPAGSALAWMIASLIISHHWRILGWAGWYKSVRSTPHLEKENHTVKTLSPYVLREWLLLLRRRYFLPIGFSLAFIITAIGHVFLPLPWQPLSRNIMVEVTGFDSAALSADRLRKNLLKNPATTKVFISSPAFAARMAWSLQKLQWEQPNFSQLDSNPLWILQSSDQTTTKKPKPLNGILVEWSEKPITNMKDYAQSQGLACSFLGEQGTFHHQFVIGWFRFWLCQSIVVH